MLTAIKECGQFDFWVYKVMEAHPKVYLKMKPEEIIQELHRVYLSNRELTPTLPKGEGSSSFPRRENNGGRPPTSSRPLLPRPPPTSPSFFSRPFAPTPFFIGSPPKQKRTDPRDVQVLVPVRDLC
jgi:hypothetical protein